MVYEDKKLELYSLHAHKYLIQQVMAHGALFSHSCFGDESFLGSLKRSRREQPTTTINNIFADEKIYDMSYLDPNVHRDYFVYFKNLYQIQFNAIIDNTFSLYCCFLRGIVKFS
ncbi:unnamed protein product [Rotaria socialis]|uniref:Uncharacterized protein n=1 Tax=Rotaria socialis TaxID=392032 RepID=A0A817VII7_9BILA|nr:unnamed protein product [Rotaria socialis]CAF3457083.1 unnamed protein product [Rotaria socialis]